MEIESKEDVLRRVCSASFYLSEGAKFNALEAMDIYASQFTDRIKELEAFGKKMGDLYLECDKQLKELKVECSGYKKARDEVFKQVTELIKQISELQTSLTEALKENERLNKVIYSLTV